MKKYVYIIVIVLFAFKGNAQDDHLEPKGTYGIYGGVLFDYFTNNMFQALESSLDDTLVRFMALPEFEPEKSFCLKKDDSISYSIHVHQMTVNNLLGREEYCKIVRMGMYKVEKDFAETLIKLFQTALEQTMYSKTQVVDRDGTLFLFTTRDTSGIVRYAEKWSPINCPNIEELVSICEGIIACHNIYDNKEQLKLLKNRMINSIIALNSNTQRHNQNSKYEQKYDISRYMNETKDTVICIKRSETIMIENDSVVSTDVLVKDYYIKMSPYSDKLWKNTRTGVQNIEFIKDKDRGKNIYYARKRYRILDLR